MDQEIWKPVTGFADRYQVSNLGNIKSLRGNWKQKTQSKLLIPHRTKQGYCIVQLCRAGTKIYAKVHRLVAAAFIGDSNGLCVNHINGIKDDNRVCNLEYVTPAENSAHAALNGLSTKGERNSHSKLRADDVLEIRRRFRKGNISQTALAKEYHITSQMVGRIVRGQSWQHLLSSDGCCS